MPRNTPEHAGGIRQQAARYSEPQRRTIAAALDLFARQGVAGTSLQMIADAVGVTKAAIYHQFRAKDAIVLAVAEVELARLEAAVEAAEAAGDTLRARDELLVEVVGLAVQRRHAVSTLQNDPVLVRFLAEHEPFAQLMVRLFSALLGDQRVPADRVRAAVLSAAIGGAVAHPFVADLDDEALRVELLDVTRRLVLLPG